MQDLSARETAIAFFNDVSAGRAAEAWARLAPDVAYDVIAPPPFGGRMDRDGLGHVYALVAQKLATGLTLTIKGVISEDDRVSLEVESSAMTIDGRHYNNHYHFLFVIKDGLIVEGREYLDSAHLMDVIGS